MSEDANTIEVEKSREVIAPNVIARTYRAAMDVFRWLSLRIAKSPLKDERAALSKVYKSLESQTETKCVAEYRNALWTGSPQVGFTTDKDSVCRADARKAIALKKRVHGMLARNLKGYVTLQSISTALIDAFRAELGKEQRLLATAEDGTSSFVTLEPVTYSDETHAKALARAIEATERWAKAMSDEILLQTGWSPEAQKQIES